MPLNLENKRKYNKEYCKKNSKRLLKYHREWSALNRETSNKCNRRYRRTLKGRFSELKKKCVRSERTFTLTFEEYCEVVSKPCFYCANKFGKAVEAGCGLDRIDSSIGYEPSNVVSCCKDCNTIKSNLLTLEEMKAAMSLVLQMRESH